MAIVVIGRNDDEAGVTFVYVDMRRALRSAFTYI